MNEILDYLNLKENGSPQVFMGDINLGPGYPELDITAEFPDHYDEIVDDGYANSNTA